MFSRIKSLSNACAPDLQQHQQEPDASSAPESMSEQQPRSPEYGTSPTSSEDLQLHPLHEIHRHQEEPPAQTFNYNTATYLMGGSGVSLDGRSLVVPMDRDREFDEVSSINTGHYTHEMRIVADAGPDVEYANHQNDNDDHDYEGPIGAGGMSPGTDDGMLKNGTNSNSFEYHTARPSKRDAKTMDSDSYEGGCLPLWITDAPRWLKIVIVLSTALLVGAIVLIGVGASLAVQKNNGGTEAVQKTNPSGPNQQPVASPTGDSTSGNFPTASPPTGNAPTTPGGTDDGDDSAAAPVASPTEPASTPQQPTTTAPPPTASPTASSVSFYVTGGRFTGDALADLPQQLNSLPYMDDNTVMFHLGDWNSPFATSCVEESYQTNVDLFSNSTVPVYFVPGDNEYNGKSVVRPPNEPINQPIQRRIESTIPSSHSHAFALFFQIVPTRNKPFCSGISICWDMRLNSGPLRTSGMSPVKNLTMQKTLRMSSMASSLWESI